MRVVSFTGPDTWSKIELMARRPDAVGNPPQGADPELNVTMTAANQQNEVRAAWRGTRAGGSGDTGGLSITPSYRINGPASPALTTPSAIIRALTE